MLWIPFFFCFGTLIGSFLNVCIYRIPNGLSIAWPASHCPRCHSTLHAMDLIPLLSWLFTKGTCRYCKSSISIQYPLVEFATGLLTVMLACLIQDNLQLAMALLLLYNGIVISAIDLKHRIIPMMNNIFYLTVGISITLVRLFMLDYPAFWDGITGALIAFLIMSVFVFAGAWGAGDLKMMTALGLVLGLKLTLLSLLLGVILGGFAGLYLIVVNHQPPKSKMAFGPYLVLASLTSYVVGIQLIDWYFATLFV